MARSRNPIRRASDKVYQVYRRFFGRYGLDDPRPYAKASPYTYFLPSQIELDAIAVGDEVKLIFRGQPRSREWDAERMWVEVTAISETVLEGILDNHPSDMPQIKAGDRVRFQRFHVVTTQKIVGDAPEVREYWDRCLVDKCVTANRKPVHFLYREEPDITKESDRFPDSGWRIRGDYRGLTDAEIDARPMEYVALGVVLNADDSWLHLIDKPVGSRFIRNFTTGEFVPEGG